MEEKGRVKNIPQLFSPEHEIPKIASECTSGKLALFPHVKGYESFRVLTGLYTAENIKSLFGLKEKRKLLNKIVLARQEKKEGTQKLTQTPPVHQNVIKPAQVNLQKLPIPTLYPKDRGPYITAGIVLAKDPEYGMNASYHRMSPISKNKLVARVVKRDLWSYLQRAREQDEKLEAAVAIGVNPSLAISAASSPSINVNELDIASTLSEESEYAPAKTLDLKIPARAEIILEGYFAPKENAEEGPFVDITGTYDKVRQQPVFTVKTITMRKNPIFHIILPGGVEHKTLMGLPKEAQILRSTSEVSIVKNVNLSMSGCGWLDAIIAIQKKQEDEAINTGMAAITGHSSVKRVIVVDPDINVTDMEEVQWAVLTRAHPAKDYLIIPKTKGSSLDHTGKKRGKIIIDATIKGEETKFKRAKIPSTEKVKAFLREKCD